MRRVILALVALVLLTGASSVPDHSRSEYDATRTLRVLEAAYLEKDPQKFFEQVSDSAYFSVLDLKNKIADHFRDFSQVDLNIVVDYNLPEKDKAVLKTHWQKRQVRNSSGKLETSEGSADFIFKAGAKALVLDIQGDSPF